MDNEHYQVVDSERHQKASPILPEGAPIPDVEEGGCTWTAYASGSCLSVAGAFAQGRLRAHGPLPNNFVVVRGVFAHQVRPE